MYKRQDALLATTGDTLTLFFETSERIASPEDGALAPEIEIHDNDSNKIGIGAVSVQSTDAGTDRLWKAEFTIPDEEVFSNYEMDLGFQISVKDPSGNPRVIGFDELGTLIDETGTQTTQVPSNGDLCGGIPHFVNPLQTYLSRRLHRRLCLYLL